MVAQYGREPRSAESIKNSLQLSVARNRKCRRFLKCAQIYKLRLETWPWQDNKRIEDEFDTFLANRIGRLFFY